MSKQVIVAIIGGLAVIIAAAIGILFYPREKEITISITDSRTGAPLEAWVYLDGSSNGSLTKADGTLTLLGLKDGSHAIRVEKDSYKPAVKTIDQAVNPVIIKMEWWDDLRKPLSLTGWSPWNGLQITPGARENEVIVTGELDAGGFNSSTLNLDLRGRILVLSFSNTQESEFSNSRMVKMTVNRNDGLLSPTNKSLIFGEYLPASDTSPSDGVEYLIPADFDGKIGFVFYQANLKNLRITAWYK